MSKEKIYPKGLMVFKPHEKAPDFVKGTLMITPNELIKFCKENINLMTEYKGNKQLKCQILEGDKGLYFVVDTWKPEKTESKEQPKEETFDDVDVDSLPF